MNISIVYLEVRAHFPGYTGGYSEGVASICAVLKQQGHRVTLIHLTQPEHAERSVILKRITDSNPDIVAFSTLTPNFPYARQINEYVKETLGVPTIVGGIHATFAYEQILAQERFDFVAVGEGEVTLPPLLAALADKPAGQPLDSLPRLPGILTRKYPEPWRLHDCQVKDLDTLPPPDRDIFDFPRLRESLEQQAQFLAGRGCPFDCTYCANRHKRELFGAGGVRMKSPRRIIDEIKGVVQRHSFIRNLFFQDDILPLNRRWFAEFVDLYEKEVDLPCACNIHPLLINDKVCEQLARLRCRSVQIGVESGSPVIREQVLNRRMTNDQIKQAFATCHRHGIEVATFNMIGNYSETLSQALETVKLNAELGPVRAYSTITIPYPGTVLNKICRERSAFVGGVEPRDYPEYTERPIVTNPSFSDDQVIFIKNWFGILVRLYKWLPKAKLDRLLTRKRFPFALLNKTAATLKPLAIRVYLGVIAPIRSRF